MKALEIRVRGFHTDLYGHVNNARYLEFLEAGRWHLFEESVELQALVDGPERFFVVNININYRRGLKVNDVALVHTRLDEIGNRSALLRQEIRNKESGEVCTDALITFVISDGDRALPLEGARRALLERLPRGDFPLP